MDDVIIVDHSDESKEKLEPALDEVVVQVLSDSLTTDEKQIETNNSNHKKVGVVAQSFETNDGIIDDAIETNDDLLLKGKKDIHAKTVDKNDTEMDTSIKTSVARVKEGPSTDVLNTSESQKIVKKKQT